MKRIISVLVVIFAFMTPANTCQSQEIENVSLVQSKLEGFTISVGHYSQMQECSLSLKEWHERFGFLSKGEVFSLQGKEVSTEAFNALGEKYSVLPDAMITVMKHDRKYYVCRLFTDFNNQGNLIVEKITVSEIRHSKTVWRKKSIFFDNTLVNTILSKK